MLAAANIPIDVSITNTEKELLTSDSITKETAAVAARKSKNKNNSSSKNESVDTAPLLNEDEKILAENITHDTPAPDLSGWGGDFELPKRK
jgi:D-alanine-D-alanine ligase-like ATP-grasp enzyme